METPQDPESQQPTPAGAPPTTPPKRSTLAKVLPSDRLTRDRQIEALKAFAAVYEANGTPVTNQQAGEVASPKMAANTIIVTNAFFVDVGLLTRVGNGFVVAPEVLAFLKASAGISPETASEKLRPIFEKQWFMQLLAPRLRLNPQDISTVHKILGEAASAGKEHIPRLDLLIDFLCFVGLTRKEGNQLAAGSPSAAPGNDPPPPPDPNKKDEPPEEQDETLEKHSLTLDANTKKKIVIYAPFQVTAAELIRIQKWLSFQLNVTGGQPPQPGEPII
jgi:hypothetical protein